MKKQLTLCAALVALALVGCEKKGTVEGTVVDPFTGKAVEMPTVWIDSTIYGTQSAKYAFKAELQQGKFKFLEVPAGEYLIKTRRNKYILSQQKFTTTPENPNATLTLYTYSDQVAPGLYKVGPDSSEKVANEWVLWAAKCNESVVAYRQDFVEDKNATNPAAAANAKDKKAKKPAKKDLVSTPLPAPRTVDANFSMLYRNVGSVTVPIVATTYPAFVGNVADHKDCSGFSETEKKGVFAKVDAGQELAVKYLAEGLFEISGNLPKGKQILYLSQDGKMLQTYYFEVK